MNIVEKGKKKDTLPIYPTPDRTKVPAFPGAHGAGRYVKGGAEGTVYTITSLMDDGSRGTLRWAIEQSGARTIVFAVSGVIELQSELEIKEGNITIAGQSAPSKGICLKNYSLLVKADHVIIRFIRSRMGDETSSQDDAMGGTFKNKNIIIDHCSMSWSIDEAASFYSNSAFTMQWCIISESLAKSIHKKGPHGFGGIWGGETASFHHNLLAHHTNRTPRLCGSRYTGTPELEKVDIRNNVIYNFGREGAYGGEGGSYNFINNYYKPGPYTVTRPCYDRIFTAYQDNGTNVNNKGVHGKFYLSGNYFDTTCPKLSKKQKQKLQLVNESNELGFYIQHEWMSKKELLSETEFVITETDYTETATNAYESVLKYAGASYIRDDIDKRIVKETRMGIYTYEGSNGNTNGIIDSQKDVEGWREYDQSLFSKDVDGDGIPDKWEIDKGLNPSNPKDGNQYNLHKSYTNLEVYLNELVEKTFPKNQIR